MWGLFITVFHHGAGWVPLSSLGYSGEQTVCQGVSLQYFLLESPGNWFSPWFFFPGILKPSESQVVTFAVVGLQTSVKNRFLNVILFTTKDATNHWTALKKRVCYVVCLCLASCHISRSIGGYFSYLQSKLITKVNIYISFNISK